MGCEASYQSIRRATREEIPSRSRSFRARLHVLLGIGPALSSASFSFRRRSAGAPHRAATLLRFYPNNGLTPRFWNLNRAFQRLESACCPRRPALSRGFSRLGSPARRRGLPQGRHYPTLAVFKSPPATTAPDLVKAHAGQLLGRVADCPRFSRRLQWPTSRKTHSRYSPSCRVAAHYRPHLSPSTPPFRTSAISVSTARTQSIPKGAKPSRATSKHCAVSLPRRVRRVGKICFALRYSATAGRWLVQEANPKDVIG
ncbi:hypothetical protein C8R45DRAFT_509874 [Mycena sanguinolenta]|nr:hypothetical protein C8R45DRAFT_509874 [Mycena sanguinolenta]